MSTADPKRKGQPTRGRDLAPYFAAKAAMDSLAVSYARELSRWGIETSITVPGAFTSGTNHFANAGSPKDMARVAEYEAGPYAGISEAIQCGVAAVVPPVLMSQLLLMRLSMWSTHHSASDRFAFMSIRLKMERKSSMESLIAYGQSYYVESVSPTC